MAELYCTFGVSQKITKETQGLRPQCDGIHAIRWIYLETIKQPGWLRGLEIVTGVLVLMFGVLVLIFPSFGVATPLSFSHSVLSLLGSGLFH